MNARRIVPMCDASIEALSPWRDAMGPVCEDKVPQREIEQILAKLKTDQPDFRSETQRASARVWKLSHGTDSKRAASRIGNRETRCTW